MGTNTLIIFMFGNVCRLVKIEGTSTSGSFKGENFTFIAFAPKLRKQHIQSNQPTKIIKTWFGKDYIALSICFVSFYVTVSTISLLPTRQF